MSDPLREQAIEIIRARLLAARTEAKNQATTANQAAMIATQAAIDCKKLLDDTIKATESSSVQEVDPDDEWGDLVVEDPSITKLKIESNKLATEAERLNKAAEQASRTYESISNEPTEAEIKREISLLRGAATKAANEAERKRKEDEKKAEIAKREALQEEEARKIREAKEAKQKEEEERFNSLSPTAQKAYLEAKEQIRMDKEREIFISNYMTERGFDFDYRKCDSQGNPCVGGEERRLRLEGEALWNKKIEAKKKQLKKEQQVLLSRIFIRDDCRFDNCYKPTCFFLHTLTQCASSRREICSKENCTNKQCTDLHIKRSEDTTATMNASASEY